MLNFSWQVLQLTPYTLWRTGTLGEIAFAVLHCTAEDVMIASLSHLFALLLVGNFAWPSVMFSAVMVMTLGMSIGYAVYSEWINTKVRQTWEYSEFMPTIPPLGTGLSPLMQWLIVPAIGFWMIRRRQIEPWVASNASVIAAPKEARCRHGSC